jgi:hypothetical protein
MMMVVVCRRRVSGRFLAMSVGESDWRFEQRLSRGHLVSRLAVGWTT